MYVVNIRVLNLVYIMGILGLVWEEIWYSFKWNWNYVIRNNKRLLLISIIYEFLFLSLV